MLDSCGIATAKIDILVPSGHERDCIEKLDVCCSEEIVIGPARPIILCPEERCRHIRAGYDRVI